MDSSKKVKSKHIDYNENPWGIMRFLEENKYHNLPRVKPFKIRIRF
jgi:hypothetical protein